MTLVAAVIAGLGTLFALALRLFFGEREKRIAAEAERDAQVGARKDDVDRLEDVIAAEKERADKPVPNNVRDIQAALDHAGGAPLPEPPKVKK